MTQNPIIDAIAAVPPLSKRNRARGSPRCKLCCTQAAFFDIVDFNKHCSMQDAYSFGPAGIDVTYHRCLVCGFLFTDFFNSWSDEQFGRYIYNDDYIKVDSEYVSIRAEREAGLLARLLHGLGDARILDYGSGSGAFAAAMRRAGFDHIESFDPFSNPVRPTGRFDVITCYEVLEHTPDPIRAVRDMRALLDDGGCIVFSQTLQPENIEQLLGSWWYLAPRNGHMSLFTPDSLAFVARASGLFFYLWEGPYAFSTATPSRVAAQVIREMGMKKPLLFECLYAPPADVATDGWHPAEQAAQGPFRWTATDRITWRIPDPPHGPCIIRIAIPITDAVRRDLLDGCAVLCGSTRVDARFEGNHLRAEVVLERDTAADALTLVTPPPQSPREVRGACDDRQLGLAIPMRWE